MLNVFLLFNMQAAVENTEFEAEVMAVSGDGYVD